MRQSSRIPCLVLPQLQFAARWKAGAGTVVCSSYGVPRARRTSYSGVKATGRSPQKKLGRPGAYANVHAPALCRKLCSLGFVYVRKWFVDHGPCHCSREAVSQPPGGLALGCACTRHTLQLCNCDFTSARGCRCGLGGELLWDLARAPLPRPHWPSPSINYQSYIQ